ncbi:histidine phosphatase family protein [Paenibacillus harenae]|uniref:histidine phosphatase family protein n=1 Tax=Paenibacillus harenae TaxID=306543 RepID=UPI00040FDF4A|nr:histidine phosphatase family protein [Paenibacillus harenae]
MKNIYLIRHCKAEGQEPAAALTAEGEEQADRLAGFLAEKQIDYVVTSPFARTIATISPFCQKRNLDYTVDDRLKERVLSSANAPNWMELLEHTYVNLDLVYEGGESSREAMCRGAAVIEEIAGGPYRNAAVVTHGALMSLMLKSIDPAFGFREWRNLSNPDVYLISVKDGERSMERIWK